MKKALVLVDIQNDFLPGGALPAAHGDEIIPVVNAAQKYFDLIVASQDWHPIDHKNFASQHPGHKPGDIIELGGIEQILWPNHCVQNTHGAEIAKEINTEKVVQYFKKGTDPNIDSYSAFFDNQHERATGLGDFLKKEKVTDVYILGLTTEYCVKFSAIDAMRLGFKVYVIEDGCSGINLQPNDASDAIAEIKAMGVTILQSGELSTSPAPPSPLPSHNIPPNSAKS